MGTAEAENFDRDSREKMRKGYSRIGLCLCILLFTAASLSFHSASALRDESECFFDHLTRLLRMLS
eukprot:scaffold18145_cov123-Skeletonema_dohrnii-CCMP3373.AAC.1